MSLLLLINPKQFGSSVPELDFFGDGPWLRKYVENYKKRQAFQDEIEEEREEGISQELLDTQEEVNEPTPPPKLYSDYIEKELAQYSLLIDELRALEDSLKAISELNKLKQIELEKQRVLEQKKALAKKILEMQEEEYALMMLLMD